MNSPRRRFLTHTLGWMAAAGSTALAIPPESGHVVRVAGNSLRIGLNAYSFNRDLMAGKMTLDEVVEYCAAQGIEGVDLTGYYFPGYPAVPPDEFIYKLKRKAFVNGVTITGTGVRNDFTLKDPKALQAQIQLVKDWVGVAQKLGADVVRVFSGPPATAFTFDQVLDWMIPAFKECAEYGQKYGVIIGLQHHDDFLKTAEQTIRIVKAVNSDWFSVILDVGSLRQSDPYQEIERLLPYACDWQIKEQVWYGTKAQPIDLPKLRAIIEKGGYRGFLPVEALGAGDSRTIVTQFLNQVRKAFA